MRIDDVQNAFEFRLRLTLLHHRQIVTERPQARLKLLVIQTTSFFLIEMLEHHAELAQRLLGDSRLVPGLYLLFQIVLHTHTQLV